MPMPLLVDCDTGIDDALALLYLLGRPDVTVVGITTVFGNNTAAGAARNTRQVLALAGRSGIPVAVGAERPLRGDARQHARQVHGADGLGDVGLPEPPPQPDPGSAARLIAELSRRY